MVKAMLRFSAYFWGTFCADVFIKVLVYMFLIFGVLIHIYNFIYYTYVMLKTIESIISEKQVYYKSLPSTVPMAPTMLGYVWFAIYSLPDVKLDNGIVINISNEFKIVLSFIIANIFTDVFPIVVIYLITKRRR